MATARVGPAPLERMKSLARRPGRELAIHLVVLVGAAVAGTWPLARELGNSLPLGHEPAATVPLFNLWTLEWNAAAARQGFAGYWDAPLFFPIARAFTFSEPQPLPGLLFLGIDAVSGSALAAYGLLFLLLIVSTGLAECWLARGWGLEPDPALLAGLALLGLPFLANVHGTIQLLALAPALLALGLLLRLCVGPTRRRGLALGLALAATYASCG